MRNRLIMVAVLSGLWILLGSWFVGTYMAPKSVTIAELQVQDEEMKFKSTDHFLFKAGGAELTVGENTKVMLVAILEYMQAHPNRRMVLKGKYLKEELNNSAYENLGLARAERLLEYLRGLNIDMPAIETDFLLVEDFPLVEGNYYDAVDFEFKPIFSPDPEQFPDEDQPQANEEFSPFKVMGKETIKNLNLNPELMQYVDNIKAYLVEYPNRKIRISGHAEHNENIHLSIKASKTYTRMVKRFLVRNGVKDAQITSEGIGASEPIYGPEHELADNNNRVVIRLVPE